MVVQFFILWFFDGAIAEIIYKLDLSWALCNSRIAEIFYNSHPSCIFVMVGLVEFSTILIHREVF